MRLLNRYLKVKELTDNLEIDGIVRKYDDTSPFMYAKIEAIDPNCRLAKECPDVAENPANYVVVFKRATKFPILDGFCLHEDDILMALTNEEYSKYVYQVK
nr:MAG TPA: hypothetical protein [Caudoviricetes sp.]